MNAHTMEPSDGGELTIDELARAAGTVVSTIRLYQHRGLLPPPTKRGRVGYYGQHHVGRLAAIDKLQERGFSLAGIKALLDGVESGTSLQSVLGLGERASIWSAEAPETLSLVELASRLGALDLTPALVRRVVSMGLVELAADGAHVIVRSPSLLRIGSQLLAMGVPADEVLDEYELLQAHTDEVADRFTQLFRRHMWDGFVKRGMKADRVAPLLEILDQLAPLAAEVTAMSLRHSLQRAAEAFLRTEASQLGIDLPSMVASTSRQGDAR